MLNDVKNAVDGYCKYYDEALGTIHVNKLMRKAQEDLSEENLKKLAKNIFELGFFSGIEFASCNPPQDYDVLETVFEEFWSQF